jgi:hypothetical protein
MDRETAKAINTLSKKVNDMVQKLDKVMQMLNADCNDKININGNGIDDLGTMIAIHDTAIDEMATIISELEEK